VNSALVSRFFGCNFVRNRLTVRRYGQPHIVERTISPGPSKKSDEQKLTGLGEEWVANPSARRQVKAYSFVPSMRQETEGCAIRQPERTASRTGVSTPKRAGRVANPSSPAARWPHPAESAPRANPH
jgi:hypothetical protein